MTLLLDVELPEGRCDVRVDGRLVVEVGQLSRAAGEEAVNGNGGALLPGLHDHHLHLLATAAASASVDVRDGLGPLASAGEGWLRAVGWSGDGDRHVLDAVQRRRPVRVQHGSGALWVLNTEAIGLLQLDRSDHPGVERDAHGQPTGRLWRADALLGELLGRETPDLAGLGLRLAQLGVTGVTDATPALEPGAVRLLRASVPQKLQLLGDAVGTGPRKIVIADHALPSYPELVAQLRDIRPRAVAIHCVTREALILLLAAMEEVGTILGDRIEHAAVIPEELLGHLPTVVTQPGFLTCHGDRYRAEVSDDDLPDLYRYRSVLRAGGHVVPSSDAPYGPIDPWQVLRAARDRRAASGAVLSRFERVPVRVALDGMLRPLADLTAPARAVVGGAVADLVLLHVPRDEALDHPEADNVRCTWIDGGLVHGDPG